MHRRPDGLAGSPLSGDPGIESAYTVWINISTQDLLDCTVWDRKHRRGVLTLKCLGLQMTAIVSVHISVARVVTKPFLIQVDLTI